MKKLPCRAVFSIVCLLIPFYSIAWGLDSPVITAAAKGPNQINLTWSAVINPGWGYKVEIQSGSDSRYASWTELGITRNGRDYLPYWVVESQYKDPQDGTACQFPVFSLLNNTTYNFRVRCYGKTDAGVATYGSYSTPATATTRKYTERHCTQAGAGSKNGLDEANAWSLANANANASAGQRVYLHGNFAGTINPANNGTAGVDTKIVFQGDPTETVTFTGTTPINISKNYIVVDRVKLVVTLSGSQPVIYSGSHSVFAESEYDGQSTGSTTGNPVSIDRGTYNLFHRIYSHNDGIITGEGTGSNLVLFGAVRNIIQYSNFRCGGHDNILIRQTWDAPTLESSYNQIMNNLMDGGWGLGWEIVGGAGSTASHHHLVEGNVVADTGQSTTYTKPNFEVACDYATVRRNVGYHGKMNGMELFTGNDSYGASTNLIYNNVFYNDYQIPFHSGGTLPNNTIANNIFYAGALHPTYLHLMFNLAGTHTGTVVNNNLILWRDAGGVDQPTQACIQKDGGGLVTVATANGWSDFDNNFNDTPSFIDQDNHEFHLKSTSAARGKGTPVTGSYWGDPADLGTGTPDVGAFKYYPLDDTTRPSAPKNLRIIP